MAVVPWPTCLLMPQSVPWPFRRSRRSLLRKWCKWGKGCSRVSVRGMQHHLYGASPFWNSQLRDPSDFLNEAQLLLADPVSTRKPPRSVLKSCEGGGVRAPVAESVHFLQVVLGSVPDISSWKALCYPCGEWYLLETWNSRSWSKSTKAGLGGLALWFIMSCWLSWGASCEQVGAHHKWELFIPICKKIR